LQLLGSNPQPNRIFEMTAQNRSTPLALFEVAVRAMAVECYVGDISTKFL